MLFNILCLLIIGIYIFQILLYTIILIKVKSQKNSTVFKKTAILIACRNEEQNILPCLQSLFNQDYPSAYFEVWIGDDNSTDRSAEIIQHFIADKPHFHYLKITNTIGELKAKQNVLAQLAHQTDADILLITDADIIAPPQWIKTMVSAFDNENIGIVCGTTYILPKGFFNTLQSIDWLFYMGVANANLDLNIPITAVGNNMAVRTQTYQQIGGYENIPFSITEDYKLFKEILNRTPYTAKWIFDPRNTNATYGISSLIAWLHQRKRWLKGGKELPFFIWLLISFNLCAEICLYISMIKSISLFLTLLAIKTVVNGIFLIVIFNKLNLWKKQWLWAVFVYPIYQMALIPVLFIYFLLPLKVQWKNRTY